MPSVREHDRTREPDDLLFLDVTYLPGGIKTDFWFIRFLGTLAHLLEFNCRVCLYPTCDCINRSTNMQRVIEAVARGKARGESR